MNLHDNRPTSNPNTPNHKSVIGKYMTLAMQNGLKLGALFVIQALSMLLYKWGMISSLLFFVGMIGVPIYIVILGNQFRDRHLGGYIRYSQAVGFLSWSYLFALIIAALSFFIVFTILFNDINFLNMMEENIAMLEEVISQMQNSSELIDGLRGITPRYLTIQFVISALFFGVIYIYIVGIFIKRTNK